MQTKAEKGLQEILENLPAYEKKARKLSEIILANLVMISEIPAPTFGEEERMRFLVNRFTESHLQNCSTDEKGNGLGILPGKEGKRNILITAHLDTVFDKKVDHTISVQPDFVLGPGVGDNALGLAALASLPMLLESLKIRLNSNLILMGCARSLEKGNIEGLRFFLDKSTYPISNGICVEGTYLGRICYSSIGMMSCEITFRTPDEYDWSRFEAVGAISAINEVINRILTIPLPRKPRTGIVLGSIEGGTTFHTRATRAVLRLQIRSETNEMVEEVARILDDIIAEVTSETGYDGTMIVVAHRRPGGIPFSHPLVTCLREILSAMDIKPRIVPSTGDLSAFLDKNIPAVSIGLTEGENLDQEGELIEIEPIFRGMAQLIGLILSIDRGCCNGK